MSTPLAQTSASPPAWLPEMLLGPWSFLSDYPVALSAIVLAVGLLLAVLSRKALLFWGHKITSRTITDLDDKLLGIIAGVTALVVVYLALVLAVQVLGTSPFAEMAIIRVLMSVLIVQLMRSAMRASSVGLEILGQVRHRFAIVEERTIPLFALVMTVIIVAIGTYALLEVWNIDPTAWLASAGIMGIAVGFAARDTLANLFAGFFIIADAPYSIGDYIVLNSGERGFVVNVGIRSTRIRTRDDVEIIIPNAEMANTKIVNESGGIRNRYRIHIHVGVAYGSDLEKVCALLLQVAAANPEIAKDPKPLAQNLGFGDSSVNLEVLAWIRNPGDRSRVSHELYMAIYKAFNRENIVIPFPQQDVWIRRADGPDTQA